MNNKLIFDYVLRNVEAHGDQPYLPTKTLEQHMLALYSRREDACVYPPSTLSPDPDKAVSVLRERYKDDVSRVSLVLNHFFPDRFLFYRVSKLEGELFQAFDFFADICSEFRFLNSRIGQKGFEKYLLLNKSLLAFGRHQWPHAADLQGRMCRFLYDNLAKLFLQTNDYNRYWINVTKEEPQPRSNWSGRKDMRKGDVVFMYCTAPKKAVTDIYRITTDPRFDPWGEWDGFWMDIERISSIPPISVGQMRKDPVLSQWSVLRRSFQGIVTEAVPHSCYNQLLTFLPSHVRDACGLQPEAVAELGSSGRFASEEQFEDEVIEPLLRGWGFRFERQHLCKCHFGTQDIHGFVDFLVSDQSGAITLFENKLKIVNDEQLQKAVDQAKSYALLLGLPSFVVASPEGLKLYSLSGNREELVAERAVGDDKPKEEAFRNKMLSLGETP